MIFGMCPRKDFSMNDRELIEVEDSETIFKKEQPWEDVGVEVDSGSTTKEMLKKAGLDWEVYTRPCFAQLDDGELMPIGKQALIRDSDNQLLDIISDEWRAMQNRDALDFFKEISDLCNGELSAVGSIKDGKIIWAFSRLDEAFNVTRNKDKIQAHLLFTNPHSYGRSIELRLAITRMASGASLILPLKGNQSTNLRINHKTNFNPDFINDTIRGVKDGMKTVKEASSVLMKTKVDYSDAEEYLKTLFPAMRDDGDRYTSRNANFILKEVLEDAPDAELSPGTYWGLFWAVCYLIDYAATRSIDSRLDSAWFGNGHRLKIKALTMALNKAK